MVIIVTRDVADRFRGFLASVMLEIAPCVYTAPRMNAGVRERIWKVIEEWFTGLGGGSIVMTWSDSSLPSGQGIRTLGLTPREFTFIDGLLTTRFDLGKLQQEMLSTFERLDSHKNSSKTE